MDPMKPVKVRKVLFLRQVTCSERLAHPLPGEPKHARPFVLRAGETIDSRERYAELLVTVCVTAAGDRVLDILVPTSTHHEGDPYAMVIEGIPADAVQLFLA
jgi:hypothetical protein